MNVINVDCLDHWHPTHNPTAGGGQGAGQAQAHTGGRDEEEDEYTDDDHEDDYDAEEEEEQGVSMLLTLGQRPVEAPRRRC
jgi:hypothetical protein